MSKPKFDPCTCGEKPTVELTVYGYVVSCPSCGDRPGGAYRSKAAAAEAWNEAQEWKRLHGGLNYKQWLDRQKWMGESRDKAEATG